MQKIFKNTKLFTAVMGVLLLIVVIVAMSIRSNPAEVQPEPNSDLIIENNNNTSSKDFSTSIDVDKIMSDYQDVLEKADSLTILDAELVTALTEAQILITNEVNQLKLGNQEMIQKYFGVSDVFTPEIISDRVSPASVNFIINTEMLSVNTDSIIVYVHICTLDYHAIIDFLMDNKTNPDAENQVALQILNGKYDICYTIPVTVKDNTVLVSEEFKQALTGGWYQGVNVNFKDSVCILK